MLSRLADQSGGQPHAAPLAQVREQVGGAVVALQFQDLATQLLTHAMGRVHAVADWLGDKAMPEDGEGPQVQFVVRACPVAQRQMDAGSIELY